MATRLIMFTPRSIEEPSYQENGALEPVTEEALAHTAKFIEIKENSVRSLAGLASAKCTNEENHLFQKLMRAVLSIIWTIVSVLTIAHRGCRSPFGGHTNPPMVSETEVIFLIEQYHGSSSGNRLSDQTGGKGWSQVDGSRPSAN